MTVTPEHYNRRSFVYRRLVAAGATFAEAVDTAVATAYPDSPTPALGLVDLSPLPRTGVRGPRALAWLGEQAGWPVPEVSNQSAATGDGALVLRLSAGEAVIVPGIGSDGNAVRELHDSIPGAGAWQVPRRDSHCWFVLRGDTAVDCLAKLCGVDLRPGPFPPGSIAQTSVARLNTVVCRDPVASAPTFHLLADSASAVWFWDALLDAMQEFGGGPLGIDELT